MLSSFLFLFFFFNDTATTEIYTLSLHDALPIYIAQALHRPLPSPVVEKTKHHLLDTIAAMLSGSRLLPGKKAIRSEEHTSELQSRLHLVCRLLLEKKKTSGKTALKTCGYCVHC